MTNTKDNSAMHKKIQGTQIELGVWSIPSQPNSELKLNFSEAELTAAIRESHFDILEAMKRIVVECSPLSGPISSETLKLIVD